MKKILCVLSVIIVSGISGCKADSDILATYRGGEITRGDFYNWIESRRYNIKSLLKSRTAQMDKLRRMALERITIAKAKEEGFDKNPEFAILKEPVSESVLMKRLYEREIKEKARFKEPAVRTRIILVGVRDYEIDPKKRNKRIKLSGEELDKRFKDAAVKAGEIIRKLDNGEDFGKLAGQYSDDVSKRKGGDIGFVVRYMLPPELAEAVFSLKEGEYTRKPVRTMRGLYIAKAEDKEELTEKNIEDVIEDKSQAMKLKSGLFNNYARQYVDKLLNAADVKYFEDKVLSKKKNDIIFIIGSKNYTVADLEKRIESRRNMQSLGNRHRQSAVSDSDKKNLARSYYQFEVLKRDALKKGIDKDPEYLKELQARTDIILAREYTKFISAEGIRVTDREIKEEYSRNKDRIYSRSVQKGNKRVKQPEPLNRVRDRIERNLLTRKKTEKSRLWEKQILEEFSFRIDESRLEGGK